MKIVFSPCLFYCKSNALFDLYLLNDTLDFIVKYLDGGIDNYDDAFYNDNRLYIPPIMNTTEYIQYLSITTNLYKLKSNGENIVILNHNITYKILDDNFDITNANEFQYIIDYLNQLYIENKLHDVIMFVKKDIKISNLRIMIDKTNHSFPIVGDPLLDETGNFDAYLKDQVCSNNTIFKFKEICKALVDVVKSNVSFDSNGSLFKKYGKIIALRNRFIPYYPKKPYFKNTYYFIGNDKHYIISIDLLHGHFEVFDNTNNQQWIAKYSFSGDVLEKPEDPHILNKIRNTHKVEE